MEFKETDTENPINITGYRYGLGTERTKDQWQTMAHISFKRNQLNIHLNATDHLDQQIVELKEDYMVETEREPWIKFHKGEKFLYAGTLTGDRYVIGRSLTCIYDVFALPAEIVSITRPTERLSLGAHCPFPPQ